MRGATTALALLLTLGGCASAPPIAPSRRALAISCEDDPHAPSTPGTIVRCARDVHGLRIAYRTTRAGDAAAIATARVVMPASALEGAPHVVVAHGTVGLADACAPSLAPPDELVRAFVARGWPVIAPDYAGLGSAGVQGYGDNDDTARSVLDAARALATLVGSSSSAQRAPIVLVGHSQGGGAVLSAQSIARRYVGDDATIAAVIAIAPGWPVRDRLETLRDPARRLRGGDELSAVVGAMFLYSWHARAYGEARAGEGFPSARRDDLVHALERGCVGSLLTTIPRLAPTLGELVDDELRRALIACTDAGECDERARAILEWSRANVMRGDPEGAPIHVLQGDHDGITTPSRTRCIVDHLRASAIEPRVCVMDADHLSIVPRGVGHAIAIAEAALRGDAAPACANEALPECVPE
ncbi:alpha/beta fold hydrolase [Sandaracinus amylolyticus]|uniref:alpha/beta fold hydrolase n=1 Tax=Sandaracinus amylolyticus TaxID=927083 RepID=UPI001F458398|nr:alpha/beta fold hydrolase [Sandaracinus amylolyticus]